MKSYLSPVTTMLALFALVYTMAGAAPQAPPTISSAARVGFVDIQGITEKATFAQELKSKIEGEYNVKMKDYKAKQDDYAKLLDEISRQETVLAEAEVNARYKKAFLLKAQLDEEKFSLDKFVKDSEDKKAPALDRILEAIQQVAQEEGCDVVFRRELLVYGRASVDISDKVVARLNAAHAESKTEAPAALPAEKKAPLKAK